MPKTDDALSPKNPTRQELTKQAHAHCRAALATVPGRKILEYLVMYTEMLVENNESEPLRMALREGRRAVALHLVTMAGYSPVK